VSRGATGVDVRVGGRVYRLPGCHVRQVSHEDRFRAAVTRPAQGRCHGRAADGQHARQLAARSLVPRPEKRFGESQLACRHLLQRRLQWSSGTRPGVAKLKHNKYSIV